MPVRSAVRTDSSRGELGLPVRRRTSHGLCSSGDVHQKTLVALLLVAVCFNLGGCASYMTASGRQQMAYRHYVQKHIKERKRALARAQKEANRQTKAKMKSIEPSDPRVSASVESAPEFRSEGISDSRPEPITDPITVSASTPMPSEGQSAPEQP